jgi:hypothetical protein
MKLPFDAGDISPTSEKIALSRCNKIQEIADWELDPFRDYVVMNQGRGGFKCIPMEEV